MHIPDGFLAAPVWAGLDAAAVPAVGYMVRRAQQGFAETRAPLLGVMGAFVFAAQMINFPVGVGTSGHLVGGALLAYTLGPAAASVVMTAILAIQALVFQDGGILALGANVLNMAVVGVWVAYLPFRLWGSGAGRKLALFTGAMLSVLASALLAITELILSGVKLPVSVLVVSVLLFLVSAALEGAITVVVMEALETLQPDFVHRPAAGRPYAASALALAAVSLAAVGILFASTHPDGLMSLARATGIAGRARPLVSSPLADYELKFLSGPWPRKAAAGIAGLLLIYAVCAAVGRWVSRSRSS